MNVCLWQILVLNVHILWKTKYCISYAFYDIDIIDNKTENIYLTIESIEQLGGV